MAGVSVSARSAPSFMERNLNRVTLSPIFTHGVLLQIGAPRNQAGMSSAVISMMGAAINETRTAKNTEKVRVRKYRLQIF